jgi:hypothetical protein
MSQRNQAKTVRQSDFQPVYDLIDTLQPANLRAAYHRLNHRTRAMLLIGSGLVVLLWVSLTMTQLALQYIHSTTGPFLLDALKSPYQLEARPLSMLAADQISILPATVGDYSVMGSTFQATPMPAQSDKDSKVAAPAQQLPTSVVNAPLGNCLISAVDGAVPSNCTGYNATFTTMGDYQNAKETTLNVTMAMFSSHAEASQVMKKLQQQALSQGSVGNYAIGVGQVDYFYSSQSNLYVFSWANGMSVFTASSSSFDDLEKFVKQFPY